ncbi:MAG: Na+:solute symporter, partial [Gemmatimonadetes bacterium]|nr:Na+:solute symporter [Gemmatimonadota bacterium]
LNVAFAATSGLWGVLVTDVIQFGIAMTGSIAAAVYALRQPEVGGLSGLLARTDPGVRNLLPDFGDWSLTLSIFVIPIAVQWWSVWYPGAEPGGGSYIAQRMLASKSERDALAGTFLFNLAHYALRPWPWIIVALASMLVYPELADIQRTFPHVDPALIGHDMAYPAMLSVLPSGLLGLMVAGLLAAYVSTISTHLNWGTSYLVHDLYRRFIRPGLQERHYVLAGRVVTALLMVCAGLLTFVLDTARAAFQLMLSVGAGTGLIYLLRWFWWRVNAWCEIAAMVSSFVIASGFALAGRQGHPIPAHLALIATVLGTTVVWVSVAFLTAPTDRAILVRFYRLVRPAGPGWNSVRAEAGAGSSPDSLPQALLGWVLGCLFVYSALFGAGSALYGRTMQAAFWGAILVASALGLSRLLPAIWRQTSHPADLTAENAETN